MAPAAALVGGLAGGLAHAAPVAASQGLVLVEGLGLRNGQGNDQGYGKGYGQGNGSGNGSGNSSGNVHVHVASAWTPARPYSLSVSSGVSHWKTDCGLALVCDRNAAGLRVTGAWQFRPGLAVEGSYVDEGQVKARRLRVEDQALQTTRLRVRGAVLGLAWWVPLDSRWLGVMRAGAAYHHARFDENLDATSTLPGLRETHSTWDPALGLGLSYRLSARWQLDGRLDWTDARLRPPPSSLIGAGTVGAHQWGVGLTYGF